MDAAELIVLARVLLYANRLKCQSVVDGIVDTLNGKQKKTERFDYYRKDGSGFNDSDIHNIVIRPHEGKVQNIVEIQKYTDWSLTEAKNWFEKYYDFETSSENESGFRTFRI